MQLKITKQSTNDAFASVCDFATSQNNHRAFGALRVQSGNRVQVVCAEHLAAVTLDWMRDEEVVGSL